MATLTGTAGYDNLTGTPDADLFHGAGGDDWLKGRDGDDLLYGDAGNDLLVAGHGFDRLYGGAGDDQLLSYLGGGVLSGGAGDDQLIVNHRGEHDDSGLTLNGGAGNDLIYLSLYARFSDIRVNAGLGDDHVEMWGNKGKLTINLGDGHDEIFIASRYGGGDGPAKVVNFNPGDAGDVIDISSPNALLDGGLVNYTEGDNPFATGHLRLMRGEGNFVGLYCDGDGGGDSFHPLILFQGADEADFTAANFGGWDPFPT
jgi:Ca2+-binding RTX toxin-like protein